MTLLWLFSAPCRARHRSSLCSRPFSPAEVGIAKTDCQTVVVFALSILSGFTGLPCLLDEWNEMILKYPHVSVCSRRGMCSALRQMLSGSVCVAIKTWTCMTECTSKLKYGLHLSLFCFLSILALLLHSLLLLYDFTLFLSPPRSQFSCC